MDEVERCLVQMEQNGFHLDVGYCETAQRRAMADEAVILADLGQWCKEIGYTTEVNWASPKQLISLLHDYLRLPPSPVWKKGRVKVDYGERKTDEAALDWLLRRADGIVKPGLVGLLKLRRVRGAIKYLSKLPGYVASDGRVHSVCGPASDSDDRAGTITWRLASKNPEVQQIPADPKKDPYRIRRAFVSPPGYKTVVADMKALEVVILAHLFLCLFDDGQLADMVVPGAPDIHCVNARGVFGEFLGWERYGRPVRDFAVEDFQNDELPELKQLRNDIKAVWYGLMYGKSYYGFATSLRDASGEPIGEESAKKIVDALYAALPALPRYAGYISDYIRRYHGVPGLGGAWCDLSELTQSHDKWKLARAQRIAQNFPMQEGGARIIGRAICDISNDRALGEALLERQIHDELDFRVPIGGLGGMVDGIKRHMTSYPLRAALQVKVGVGDNWEDAKT